jgi:ribonuclease Z
MRPSFLPRLVNPPSEDPGVFVPFQFENRALLFDIGDIRRLSTKDILKISHVFVSHTHIDHFFGFDLLLRLTLGRGKEIHLYGPKGFLKNLEGKLAGYAWNLVENFPEALTMQAYEICPPYLLHCQYRCHDRFQPADTPVRLPLSDPLYTEPKFIVSAEVLDHHLPCLAFSVKEHFRINILKEKLKKAGLAVGPWIRFFKEALYKGDPPDSPVTAAAAEGDELTFSLEALASQISLISPGQKIVYITDAGFTPANREKMIRLAENADQLFIEAAFSDADRVMALKKNHLTAYQAGWIAGRAGVKQYILFHFSPRYFDNTAQLDAEAAKGFEDGSKHRDR